MGLHDVACPQGAGDARPAPPTRPRRRLRLAGRLSHLRKDASCLLGLAVLLLASVLAVDPRGDFPLNDDWSFARSARVLFAAGDWRPLGWASMAQISHALLGYAACSVASCSFESLRGATLIAGLGLLVASFGLFRHIGAPRFAAVTAACATVFNPVIHPLLYTFMTDVPFALAMVLAAAACVAALRTGGWGALLLSTALLLLATLSRQLGLAMAASLLPVYLLASREPWALRLAKGGMPLAVCLGALLLYEHWMRATGRLPPLYDGKYADIAAALADPVLLLSRSGLNLLLSATYLGFVCLPVLVLRPVLSSAGAWLCPAAARWASIVSAAVLVSMAANRRIMPLLGNVFGSAGTGPLTLRDTYVLGLHPVPDLPVAFWIAVTAGSLVGLWLLVFHVTSLLVAVRRDAAGGMLEHGSAVRLFGVATTALYLLPLLPGDVYDRYVLAIAPVLCLALVPVGPGATRVRAAMPRFAVAYVAALAIVSILGTHDYLAWNRARWSAIAAIEAAHEADAATLDGGFEYDGYRAYEPNYAPVPPKSWWWVRDDALQIAFGPVPGMQVLRRIPYRTWFPLDRRSLVVLRRAPMPSPP